MRQQAQDSCGELSRSPHERKVGLFAIALGVCGAVGFAVVILIAVISLIGIGSQ